ncbi:MAG TPA: HAD family hydrolase [Haliangiales bacterium]|nr:HAD family hydrolase [Haliangiales bacterium]
MRPAAFLDRDGTIIDDPGYLGDPGGVRLLPGAAEAVAALAAAGYTVVVVTNQSGVGRGLYDEAAVEAVNRRVGQLLVAADPRARIERFYHCPHVPAELCECRKPRPGMLLRAARELSLDLAASLAIGDGERDVQAAVAAGCRKAVRIGPGGTHPTLYEAVRSCLDGTP